VRGFFTASTHTPHTQETSSSWKNQKRVSYFAARSNCVERGTYSIKLLSITFTGLHCLTFQLYGKKGWSKNGSQNMYYIPGRHHTFNPPVYNPEQLTVIGSF
jgi:hypothetical protein